MEIAGYISALAVGLSLGIIGSGGAILTVPILVYLFNIPPTIAAGYSLFVVGVTSFSGFISYFNKKLINIKVAVTFAIPATFTVFITRKYFVPSIPDIILSLNGIKIERDFLIMIFFALLMAAASFSMIKKNNQLKMSDDNSLLKIILLGIFVGFVSGFVGAGGGFLIIPSLVMFAKLEMKKAVGTSLLIISVNALIGFTGNVGTFPIEWSFILIFSLITVTGIFIGSFLSNKISSEKLKPVFGYFLIIMSTYIFIKEIYSL